MASPASSARIPGARKRPVRARVPAMRCGKSTITPVAGCARGGPLWQARSVAGEVGVPPGEARRRGALRLRFRRFGRRDWHRRVATPHPPAGADGPDDADAKTECGGRLTDARNKVKAHLKKDWSSRAVLKQYDGDRSLARSAVDHLYDVTGRKDALARAESRAAPGLGMAEGHFANAD